MKNIKKVLWFALFLMPFACAMQEVQKVISNYAHHALLYAKKMDLLKLANNWDPINQKDLKRVKNYLLAGVNPNCIDKFGNSALILATIHNQPELVSLLLEHKANKDYKDLCDRTALKWAKEFDNKEIAKLLE